MTVAIGLWAGCGVQQQKTTSASSMPTNFGTDWKFRAGEGVDSGWYNVRYNDAHWQKVSSAITLAAQKVKLENGFGWYRKHVSFNKIQQKAIAEAQAVMLRLGKFAACEEVYVNGQLVGKTGEFPHNFAGYFDHERNYFVPLEDLNPDGDNTIAIKFHDGWSAAGGFLGGAGLQVVPASALEKLDLQVQVKDEDYIFLGNDSIAIQPQVNNRGGQEVAGTLYVKLLTDEHRVIKEESVALKLPANQTTKSRLFGFTEPKPGFYRYEVTFAVDQQQKLTKKFNVGYEPEKIDSPNDQQADFDSFWKNSLKELKSIDPDYQLTHLPEHSKLDYDMYHVSMRSLENELIMGYYAKPKKPGKHPVIVEYMGYGSSPYFPNQTWDGFAYFVLSIRGQALNKSTNRFGTWFTYGIDDHNKYYYRGAFMDVVRALDFVGSREEIDATRIAVRGSSQGGALSVAAAALDNRVKALAIGIPFLSDFRDYFKIAPWPKSDVEAYLQEHPNVKWSTVYKTLSYFDIKNLASRIRVPLLMGIGVQDEVCPPHINFAAFNQVKSEKSWMAFATYGHSTGNAFHQGGLDLFRRVLNVKQP
jgi:cephalosporin-C deacetylase